MKNFSSYKFQSWQEIDTAIINALDGSEDDVLFENESESESESESEQDPFADISKMITVTFKIIIMKYNYNEETQ